MRFSATVWVPDSAMFWNVRAIPRPAIWCGFMLVRELSPKRTSPSVTL